MWRRQTGIVNSGRRQRLAPVSLSVMKMRRRRSSPAMSRNGSAGWMTGVSTRSVFRAANSERSSPEKSGRLIRAISARPVAVFGLRRQNFLHLGDEVAFGNCLLCDARFAPAGVVLDLAGQALAFDQVLDLHDALRPLVTALDNG